MTFSRYAPRYIAFVPAFIRINAVLFAVLFTTKVLAEEEILITNDFHDDPEGHQLWDRVADRPVEFWPGNYTDVKKLTCETSGDILLDWSELKIAMSAWLDEMLRQSDRSAQVFWEKIRPVQHRLTNIIAHHNMTTTRDCVLGMLSIRMFYMVMQTPSYRQSELIKNNNFVIDWYYYTHKFEWSVLVRSGWGNVLFKAMQFLALLFRDHAPWLIWQDCAELPGLGGGATFAELVGALAGDPSAVGNVVDFLGQATKEQIRQCPVAFATAAAGVATVVEDSEVSLSFLNMGQRFIKQYREVNDWTFVNLLHTHWPMWEALGTSVSRLTQEIGADKPNVCKLLYCPDGGTPNPFTCKCEVIFPPEHPKVTVCIFMTDTRRRSSLRNITSVLNARFWTLAFGVNRAYAEDHGYEIEYVQPENSLHFPDRKVGWAKVKVIIDRLREYGPKRCAYGVSIDTDAFIRSSEPLSAVIYEYGLDSANLILFSQEYHSENRPQNTFINGGFFIVRNSEAGVGLLEKWYNVPEEHADMADLKVKNPQGLNLCWDLKIQPDYKHVTVLAPPHLFTAPLGWFIRHNWFKDLRFEQEMQDVLLQRLQRKYGCIMCENVYDWDDFLNHDVGWR